MFQRRKVIKFTWLEYYNILSITMYTEISVKFQKLLTCQNITHFKLNNYKFLVRIIYDIKSVSCYQLINSNKGVNSENIWIYTNKNGTKIIYV